MLKRIFQIHLSGNIDSKLLSNIDKKLNRITTKIYKPTAIVLRINSGGGSIISAKNIGVLIKKFSEKHNAPFYTIAEESCLGASAIILCSGHIVHCNPYSIIGNFGADYTWFGYKKAATKLGIGMEIVKSGIHKGKFSQLKNLTKVEMNRLIMILEAQKTELRQTLLDLRKSKFVKKRLDNKEVNALLFKEDKILTIEDYLNVGLIDEICTVNDVIGKLDDFKIKNIKVNSKQGFKVGSSLNGTLKAEAVLPFRISDY